MSFCLKLQNLSITLSEGLLSSNSFHTAWAICAPESRMPLFLSCELKSSRKLMGSASLLSHQIWAKWNTVKKTFNRESKGSDPRGATRKNMALDKSLNL